MVDRLGLTGNELIAFALVYGFSQDGESSFPGSISYVSSWLGCSRSTAVRVLKSLVEKGLTVKLEEVYGGISLVRYKVSESVLLQLEEGWCQNDTTSIKMILPVSNRQESTPLDVPQEKEVSPLATPLQKENTPLIFPPEKDTILANPSFSDGASGVSPMSMVRSASFKEAVDRVYAAYPTRDVPTSNYPKGRSLCKCSKDKDKILRYLQKGQYTEEHLIKAIQFCIAEHPRGYMPNFSTFLNNIPDMSDTKALPASQSVDWDRRAREKADWQARGGRYEDMPAWLREMREG